MLEWPLIIQNLPLLLAGLWSTLQMSAVGLAIGFVIAVGVCGLRLSPRTVLRRLGGAYITIFRGVPLLIQLLFLYNVLPRLGLGVTPVVAAIAGLSLCCGAYIAEILRGGFLTLPRGQAESALMLGLSHRALLLRIQIPQVVRLTSPALVNEVILLIKASSLISVVGISELTRTAQNLAASTFLQLEFYLAAAALYCVLNVSLAMLGSWLEIRLRRDRA